jgi:branched-chain amino acid aminotransferase
MKTDAHREILVFFENRVVPLHEAKVGILTHAFNYGTGVFEGIRGYWDNRRRELFLVRPEDHFERWKRNCSILQITVPPTPEALSRITAALVRRNRFRSNVYIRPLAYKSAERIGVSPDSQDSFAITAIPFGDYIDSREGVHAGVSSWRRVADTAIPCRGKICGAYVNSALASGEARREGYGEAIFLNEDGHVAEGASCNIFLVRNGKLVTPAVSEGIVEGVTRSAVIELAHRELRLDTVERRVERSELYVADEIFFTGTAVEIAPVVSVDHRPAGSGRIGPVSAELRRLYLAAVTGALPAYEKWLFPVYRSAAAGKAA